MTKKRLLISSAALLIGSNRTSKKQIIRDVNVHHALSMADRFRARGWEVDCVVSKQRFDYIDEHFDNVIEEYGVKWSDYDKVFLYQVSINAYGGKFTTSQANFLEQANGQDLSNTEVFIFVDDPQNPIGNLCKRFQKFICEKKKYDDGTSVFPTPRIDKELRHFALSSNCENIHKFWDWSVSKEGPKFVMGGGETRLTRRPAVYGWCEDAEIIIDHTGMYQAGRDLTFGWDKKGQLPSSEIKWDVIYAGVPRPHRIDVLTPTFQDPRIHTHSAFVYDPKAELGDTTLWQNHSFGEPFPAEQSPEIHSQAWLAPIVGDQWNKGDKVSTRYWFSLAIPTVAVIHTSYDPEGKLIENEWLRKQMYWTTPDDLHRILVQVKSIPSYRNRLIEEQRKLCPPECERLFR